MSSIRGTLAGSAAVLAIAAAIAAAVAIRLAPKPPIHDSPAAVPSRASAPPSERFAGAVEESRRLARALVAGDNLPGLSVAIAVKGDVVWAEGFGWLDVDNRTPVTPATRFRLGALSKPLTAFAAALLHDRGRLDLDAPVQRYVPAYPAKQWTVTTRQLLGDVGGVHRIRGDNNDAMPTIHCAGVDEAVAMLADDPLLFQPGTQHRYSIWGWVLVSAAVQGAAGEPFHRFMTREVFEPLGMSRTLAEDRDEPDETAPSRADYSCLAGGGAFVSTPTDLVRLGSAMIEPGTLKRETIVDFQTPTRLASGEATTYALGWTVRSAPVAGTPTRIVSHRGSPAGGSVSLLTFPDLGIAVAAAANVTDAAGVNPFALQVAEAFVTGGTEGRR